MYDHNEPRWHLTSVPINRPYGIQWQRVVDGRYDMIELLSIDGMWNQLNWLVGRGTFSLSDFDQEEIDFQRKNYQLPDNAGDDVVACCLFECCLADFEVRQFDNPREACAYIDSIVR